jgi:hypothetical protein
VPTMYCAYSELRMQLRASSSLPRDLDEDSAAVESQEKRVAA